MFSQLLVFSTHVQKMKRINQSAKIPKTKSKNKEHFCQINARVNMGIQVDQDFTYETTQPQKLPKKSML